MSPAARGLLPNLDGQDDPVEESADATRPALVELTRRPPPLPPLPESN
jgi:hypothetical protein